MRISGLVRVWHVDEGWGVVDSEATPGGCWVHFSSVLVPGYRTLRTGEPVTLEYEPGEQDGYSFRAVKVWPAGHEPYGADESSGPSDAYRSTLTITCGDPKDPDPA